MRTTISALSVSVVPRVAARGASRKAVSRVAGDVSARVVAARSASRTPSILPPPGSYIFSTPKRGSGTSRSKSRRPAARMRSIRARASASAAASRSSLCVSAHRRQKPRAASRGCLSSPMTADLRRDSRRVLRAWPEDASARGARRHRAGGARRIAITRRSAPTGAERGAIGAVDTGGGRSRHRRRESYPPSELPRRFRGVEKTLANASRVAQRQTRSAARPRRFGRR